MTGHARCEIPESNPKSTLLALSIGTKRPKKTMSTSIRARRLITTLFIHHAEVFRVISLRYIKPQLNGRVQTFGREWLGVDLGKVRYTTAPSMNCNCIARVSRWTHKVAMHPFVCYIKCVLTFLALHALRFALDSPELLQILVTLTAVIKPLQPNVLGRAIVILNFVRRFQNFIADTVP